jgi:phosphatidylinositol alpha-1,6-mannosyltransferase
MKILLLAQSFPPPGAAGSVQYLSNIFSALPPQTAVIVTADADPDEALAFDANYPQRILRFRSIPHVTAGYSVSVPSRIIKLLLWPLIAFWLIVRERPQVVYLGEFNVSCLAALLAQKILRIPFGLFTYAEEITYIFNHPIHLRLLKWTLRKADVLITVSGYTSCLLQDLGADLARIQKILPSVSPAKLIENPEAVKAVRQKYSLGSSRVLLTAGRLIERKGHVTVIEALPTILRSFPNLRYVVVGCGPEEERLINLVRQADLQSHVLFVGGVDNQTLACWYEICDIFVMPHRHLAATNDTEGCPTVFLEAGAHGKPVIGGKAGGVADAISEGQTGFIIDGEDAMQLAENVCSLLGNAELSRRMGEAGRTLSSTLEPESRAAALCRITAHLIERD